MESLGLQNFTNTTWVYAKNHPIVWLSEATNTDSDSWEIMRLPHPPLWFFSVHFKMFDSEFW